MSSEVISPTDDYVLDFLFGDERTKSMIRYMLKCFVELPEEDDGSREWEWLQYLRTNRKEEFEILAERNPEIRKAVDTLYELSGNEQVRGEYEMRLKAWRDRLSQNEGYYQDGVLKGLEKGREEGLEKGRAEALLETARKMKDIGLSEEQIEAATGLSADSIK